MADWTTGLLFGSGILPTTQSAKDMRQRIALAMLMKKNTAPKTFGEGLSSIGDSFGDVLMARSLEQKAEEQSRAETGTIEKMSQPAVPGKQAAADIVGADDVVAKAPAPPPLATVSSAIATPPQQPQAAAGGYRAPPAYLASSLERLIPDPERRGYLGHLAGREAQRPGEVSPTGAAGPFQFTRGTGAQYGIPGDARFDVDKSIVAANQLTDDNAAVLTKALGRAPSPGELALAHQQGAGTAAKMLLGSGNASASNLAVNNVPGGLGPQAAAQKIMGYYGMPGSGGPRDNAAAILASRQTPPAGPVGPSDVAQEATMSDVMGSRAPQPLFAPTASNRAGDVQSDLPPVTGAVSGPMGASVGDTVQQRQETLRPPQGAIPAPPPGPQVAQAGAFPPVSSDAPKAIIPGGGFPPTMPQQIPAAPPSIPSAPQDARSTIRRMPDEYVPPEQDPQPEPPAKPGTGPIEQRMTRDYLNADVSPRIKEAAQRQIEAERAQLAIPYENQVLKYKADIANWQKRQEQVLGYKMGLPKQRAETEGQQATTRKTGIEADKAALDLGGYPAQLVQEKLKREAEVGKAQAEAEQKQEEARIVRRTGMPPDKLYERLDKEKASVEQTLKAQDAQQLARRAIRDGVITGYGANGIVAGAKFADWAFKNGMSGNLAANTETMSAALKAGLSEAVKTVNGEGGTGVSNTDVRIAEGIAGSDPGLQLKTIRSIMDRAAEINHRKIDSYESKIDRYLSGEKAEDFYKTSGGTVVPPDKLKLLLDNPSAEMKAQFNEVYGPGAADLQLSRFKRAQQRQGKD